MAQLTTILTASGKIGAEKFNARLGIEHLVVSNTGTGAVAIWKSSPDFSIDASGNTITFADANPDTITRATGSWITDGLEAGDIITIANSTLNNGTFTIDSLTATVITLIATDELAAETNTTLTIVFTNRGTKIYEFVKTAGEKFVDFKVILKGEAGNGEGFGDLYLVLPSTVTATIIYRNSVIGD